MKKYIFFIQNTVFYNSKLMRVNLAALEIKVKVLQ